MIKDCLETYYTPQERVTVLENKVALIRGRQKADAAIVAYIKEHPPAEGTTTVTIPSAYINDAFAEYNAAATAWEQAREPVIKRYAQGKTETELVKDAKDILRGIRQKDLDYHPFSKRFLTKTDAFMDLVNILMLLLEPQLSPLKERGLAAGEGNREDIDDAIGDIFTSIFSKCDRIQEKKKKEAAENGKKED